MQIGGEAKNDGRSHRLYPERIWEIDKMTETRRRAFPTEQRLLRAMGLSYKPRRFMRGTLEDTWEASFVCVCVCVCV